MMNNRNRVNTFLRNFHYLHRIINDRKIRLMSIDTETRTHYELNFYPVHIDEIWKFEKNYRLFWITDERNKH